MVAISTMQAGEPAGASLECKRGLASRILVVDDKPDICQLYAEVLKSFGYEVKPPKTAKLDGRRFMPLGMHPKVTLS